MPPCPTSADLLSPAQAGLFLLEFRLNRTDLPSLNFVPCPVLRCELSPTTFAQAFFSTISCIVGGSAAQQQYQLAGAISLGSSEKGMTLARDSDEVLKKRANASFKKEERAKDAKVGAAAYEAAGRAVAVNTERLRALRLAKGARDSSK
jgi:hypothetical protein